MPTRDVERERSRLRSAGERIDIHTTAPCEEAALADFLGRFHQRPGHSVAPDDHMRWKYWAERPDWEGSRSFAATHAGAVVAHAAAWPVRVCVPNLMVPAAHLIDWVSDPGYPGVGTWLLRQIGERVRLLIATGGSEIARRILPVLGFRPLGELHCYARPVRPLRQAWTTPERNWRLAARLVRNSFWRVLPPLTIPRGWSFLPLAPEDVPPALWCQPNSAMAVTARDSGLYQYFVRAPSARHSLHGLEKRGQLVGYFCLAFAPHVARIADLWVRSTSVDDWCAGFRTATAAAARGKDICEISAWASTPIGRDALRGAGFRLRERCMLSGFGDADVLSGRELHVQMLDSDASFLSADGAVSYLT
jgi:hypothetical protein